LWQIALSHEVQTVSFLCINAGFLFLPNIYTECAKRWQQSLDPELDRSEWRDEEVRLVYYVLAMAG
jgi:hypothetical protein